MDDLKSRDSSCRVSGVIDNCDQAHLVPASEREWWDLNMRGNQLGIQSALNGILMRSDLHRSFDTGAWVPMVKEGDRLVVYVLRPTEASNQFIALWHNREMQQLVGVDRRCLFARVAWAVLSMHHEFLTLRRLAKDNLLVRTKDGELKEMPPKVFEAYSRPRSKNPSPTKRPRLQSSEEENDEDEDIEQPLYEPDDDSIPCTRGRKRVRSSSLLSSLRDLEPNHFNTPVTTLPLRAHSKG